MKIFIAFLVIVLSTATAHAEGCDALAKARATAVLDIQGSDKFITNDGALPLIRNVMFIGVTSPEKRNDYHIAVSFGTDEMKKNWNIKSAVYIISVDPESCLVRNIRLLGISSR